MTLVLIYCIDIAISPEIYLAVEVGVDRNVGIVSAHSGNGQRKPCPLALRFSVCSHLSQAWNISRIFILRNTGRFPFPAFSAVWESLGLPFLIRLGGPEVWEM